MQKLAKKYSMVLVVRCMKSKWPAFFQTAAVIRPDGKYLGKYRKHHIPHCHPGFWEKFYFTPGNAGYPVFETRYARVGVYIVTTGISPKARESWDSTARRSYSILPPPWRGLSEYLWELEQPAHAVAKRLFRRRVQSRGDRKTLADRRILREELFLQSPRQIVAQASRDKDELVVADLNLDESKRCARRGILSRPPAGNVWRNRAHAGRRNRASGGLGRNVTRES